MASFGVKTRRAITFSISVFSCHIIHRNVDDYVVYYRVNRDVDMMTESYKNTVQNSGVLARSWLEAGGVCCVRRTIVSFPRGRIILLKASKIGRIN